MAMGFLLNDVYGDIDSSEIQVLLPGSRSARAIARNMPRSGNRGKLWIPPVGEIICRKRLLDLIDRSTAQYGATLISGRAGAGKTTLAADHANRQKNVSWYSLDPSDADWSAFSEMFCTSVCGQSSAAARFDSDFPSEIMIAEYLGHCFAGRYKTESPHLIVLDNIHHLFDARWFSAFFKQLIFSLDSSTRLLMLCRGKPSAPLWRMRSKQMLNVIEENLLDLNLEEAEAICKLKGLANERARHALERSHGRVGTFLNKFIESILAARTLS